MRRFSNEKLRGYGLTFAVLMQMIVAACNGEARNYNSDNSNANNGRPAETTDLETANIQPSAEVPTAPALAPTNTQESGGTTDSNTTPVEPENQDNSETEQPTAEVPTAPALAPTPTQEEGGDSSQQTQEELSMPSLEELTMENLPQLAQLEKISNQEGFIQSIAEIYPDLEVSDIIPLEIARLGNPEEIGTNRVVIGTSEGVVLAIYDLVENKFHNAIGGKDYLDENGNTVELPFYIILTANDELIDRMNGPNIYQYGTPELKFIQTIKQSQLAFVKSIFTSLSLTQSKNSFSNQIQEANIYNMTNQQREEITELILSETQIKLNNGQPVNFMNIRLSDSSNTKILMILNEFRPATPPRWNRTEIEGSDGYGLNFTITSSEWTDPSTARVSPLGGKLLGALRERIGSFNIDDFIKFFDQDAAAMGKLDNGNGDLTFMSIVFASGAPDTQSLLDIINDIEGNTPNHWDATGLPIYGSSNGENKIGIWKLPVEFVCVK